MSLFNCTPCRVAFTRFTRKAFKGNPPQFFDKNDLSDRALSGSGKISQKFSESAQPTKNNFRWGCAMKVQLQNPCWLCGKKTGRIQPSEIQNLPSLLRCENCNANQGAIAKDKQLDVGDVR
jgi:hypothetical protein